MIADNLVRHRTDEPGTNGVCSAERVEAEMSRFYFHIRMGDQVVIDQEGSDLPDPAAAREEALAAARQILADAIRSGNEAPPEAFVISDGEGRELETVPFAVVLPKWLKC